MSADSETTVDTFATSGISDLPRVRNLAPPSPATTAPTELPTKIRPVPTRTSKPPGKEIVLCTVTHRVQFDHQFPPDGLCTLVFYTEASFDWDALDFYGAYDALSFDAFRKKARSSSPRSKTGYGVSFDYMNAASVRLALENLVGQNKFSNLWRDNLYHYGVLHVWDTSRGIIDAGDKLKVISEVKKRQDVLGRDKNGQLAMGFQFRYQADLTALNDVIKRVQANYPITILVKVTHMFQTYSFPTSNGPSTWNADSPYKMSLIASVLNKTLISIDVTFMVSFTMAVTLWQTMQPWTIDTPYWRTNTTTPVEYAQRNAKATTPPWRLVTGYVALWMCLS
ncbi:uncharacterized protein LOC119463648 [Dermacentor silvarum]|uniref:uncharacterized protein LOC119463648 n=1 Tax=Dermacentor silvarum TaxID=543639 RepID=UPI0021006A64|nr:uncharacterized protein LOC119463648 [Dermacentor silvarum]